MREITKDIQDIKDKLQKGVYKNEEHIRVNLVYRLLSLLGWDIWNPAEVYAEFIPVKHEDNKKVDIALLVGHNHPEVFIEVKGVNTLKTGNLNELENQLRNYNRDLTAKFTILTDGNIWRFYYSLSSGRFEEKCFKEISFLNDKDEGLQSDLNEFLLKENVLNEKTTVSAKKLLESISKTKMMALKLNEAQKLVNSPPFLSLPETLKKLCDNSGVYVSIEEVKIFLEKPIIIDPIKNGIDEKQRPEEEIYKDDILGGDPTGSSIIKGRFGEFKSNKWNSLLDIAVEQALMKGISPEEISRRATINIKSGIKTDQGYRRMGETNFSIQGVDARRSGNALKEIARVLNIELFVRFQYYKGQYNGKEGVIVFPERSAN